MSVKQLDRDRLVWMYEQMLRIREFEERVKRTFIEHPGVIRGHTHLADGAEASIVGSRISLMRCSAENMTNPKRPRHEIRMATKANALPTEVSQVANTMEILKDLK